METKNLQNQKGFTLVEIAIVLVIIGLLLGGVLKGQEMITAAKIKNDTDSLVGMQAAAYAYRDRMGYYPGSARAAAPDTIAANKTQITAADSTAGGLVPQPSGNFFEDLADQGFLKDPNVATSTDESGGYTVGFAAGGTTAVDATDASQNYVCINYTAGIDNAEEILRGMDIKLDDGDSDEGKFRYSSGTGAGASSGCFEI